MYRQKSNRESLPMQALFCIRFSEIKFIIGKNFIIPEFITCYNFNELFNIYIVSFKMIWYLIL